MVGSSRFARWVFVLAAILAPVFAAADGLRARMDPPTVTTGEQFTYIVESSEEPEGLKPPISIDGPIELVSYFGVSRSAVIGPQGRTTTYTYRWLCRANGEGEFLIGPSTASLGGVAVESNSIQGVVDPIPHKEVGGLGSVGMPRSGNPTFDRQLEGAYFSVTEAPETVYVRQAFTLQTYLYRDPDTPYTLRGVNVGEVPAHQQFITVQEASGYENALRWERVQIGDKLYERTLIDTVTLVPTRPGDAALAGREFVIRVSGSRNARPTFFDDGIPASLPPQEAKVAVRALPEPPPGVVGQIVGRFKPVATLDRETLPDGELLTWTVRLSGMGYLGADGLELPEAVDGLSFVSDEVNFRVDQAGRPLVTTKEFRRVFMARQPGNYTVPSVSIAIVDPETGKQTVAETEALPFEVTPTKGNTVAVAGTTTASPRGEIRSLGDSDILFIEKTPLSESLGSVRGAPYRSIWFWLVHGLLLSGALVSVAAAARARALGRNPDAVRARASRAKGHAALEEARKLAAAGSPEEFYAALQRGLFNVVASVSGRQASGLTADEAENLARARGADDSLCRELRTLLDRCAEARYAPVGGGDSRNDDLAAARTLASSLEKARR